MESQGYIRLCLTKTDINIISDPITYLKGRKIVQLIRPRIITTTTNRIYNDLNYSDNFIKLISDVDISCCGVSYEGKLYENVPHAISHCLNKVFQTNYGGRFYNEKRIIHRKAKLLDRGWEELTGLSDIRNIKINDILENNLDYIREY